MANVKLNSIPIPQRFMSKVSVGDDCWIWTAGRFPSGYGAFSLKGRLYRAHRMAFMLFRGEIPPGLCVCHRCDQPACVNPAHLFLGTNAENSADMVAKHRHAAGVRNGRAKLTEDDVREIRECIREGDSQRHVAQRFGVSQVLVGLIARRKSWRNVE